MEERAHKVTPPAMIKHVESHCLSSRRQLWSVNKAQKPLGNIGIWEQGREVGCRNGREKKKKKPHIVIPIWILTVRAQSTFHDPDLSTILRTALYMPGCMLHMFGQMGV